MEGSARSNGKKLISACFLKKWRAGLERECWQQHKRFQPFFFGGSVGSGRSARSDGKKLISVCFHKMESGVGEGVLAALN